MATAGRERWGRWRADSCVTVVSPAGGGCGRWTGRYGLWRAHGEQALPSLEKVLADEEAEVRGQAVIELRNLSGDKARDLIQMQLNREKDASVLKILRQ